MLDHDDDDAPESAPESGLDARQERAAVLLAAGSTRRAVAAELGIGERTVYNWIANPAFAAYVTALRDEALSTSVGRLSVISANAVIVLSRLLDSPSELVRLRAAAAVLDHFLRYREMGDMAIRMAALERRMDARTTLPRRDVPTSPLV